MCGYCTESAALAELLGEMKDDVQRARDPLLSPIYLQEASDWRKEFRSWKSLDHPKCALVALCRQWSECVGEMTPDPPRDLQVLPIGWPLKAPSIDVARATLDAYITEWITPSPGTEVWDHKTLYERFLGLSIAFDVVANRTPDDSRIAFLATHSPSRMPAFNGLDLWLQRRSLHACVAHWGVGFIVEYLDDLRFETVLSVVMGGLLTPGDLVELQALLEGRSLGSSTDWIDDLLETIQMRIQHLDRDSRQPREDTIPKEN